MNLTKIRLYNVKRGINYIKRCGIKNFWYKVSEKINDKTEKNYRCMLSTDGMYQNIMNEDNKFAYEPKISIVVPVFNTPKNFLMDLIESVSNQTYSNWELCILDGGSDKDYIRPVLNDYASKDSRIKIKFLNENKGISGNTNEAISLATGEYIGLLDHDDILHANAVFEVVKVINNEKADVIYTDEDKISEDGKERFEPHFKPDWSPDTLRSYNYICHFFVFKKSLIDKVGLFRKEFDGSQDYDFILRITEVASKISHIPKILYHWRINRNSTAYEVGNKEYAVLAGKKALESHLERIGLRGNVNYGEFIGSYKINYDINEKYKVSIIFQNNAFDLKELENYLKNVIQKAGYSNYEIIVLNNGYEINNSYELEKLNVKIINIKEESYSKVINYGVERAEGDFILLISEGIDTITNDWLKLMVSYIQNKNTGIVGIKFLYKNRKIKNAGLALEKSEVVKNLYENINRNYYGYMGRLKIVQNLSAISENCVLLKKDLFEEVNGFDENISSYLAFIDFCLKARRLNKFIVFMPFIEVCDNNPNSYNKIAISDTEFFINKWGNGLLERDRYFNLQFIKW
ncbi:glycosyltransferase [Clostridium sp. C2-6-12]|uniref:glycosyltransferase family 2 protein n=1 Tax=Clostridium sp. C2-6-12 TaxID=2698832 RepID=UPI00136A8157|nr:glycosyltransferase [Clostridium sp. C2-6-12]